MDKGEKGKKKGLIPRRIIEKVDEMRARIPSAALHTRERQIGRTQEPKARNIPKWVSTEYQNG